MSILAAMWSLMSGESKSRSFPFSGIGSLMLSDLADVNQF